MFSLIPSESQKLITEHPCARKLKERLNWTKSPYLSEGLIDLLDQMLKMEPNQRISAEDAYSHDYFRQDPRPWAPKDLPLISEDTHEYSVKQQKKTKELQSQPDNNSKLVEKYRKDHENKNLYRRPPDLRPLDDQELNEYNALSKGSDNLQTKYSHGQEVSRFDEISGDRERTHNRTDYNNRDRSYNKDKPRYRDSRDDEYDRRRDRGYHKHS